MIPDFNGCGFVGNMVEIDSLGLWVSQIQRKIRERAVGRTPETGKDAGEDVGRILWVWVKK
jgi:hypothetical protein